MCDVPEGAALIANSGLRRARVPDGRTSTSWPASLGSCRRCWRAWPTEITGGAPTLSRTLRVALGEGTIAELLTRVAEAWPDLFASAAIRPFLGGRPSVAVVIRGTDADRLAAAEAEVADGLRALAGRPVAE